MNRKLAELRIFFREFRRSFRTTGAILPSSGRLASALVRYIAGPAGRRPAERAAEELPARRILEVGPGTGAVTRKIIRRIGPRDEVDLVELNGRFVRVLEHRFQHDLTFRMAADRARIIHSRLEDLPLAPRYDVIISGLPLNNLSHADARQALDALTTLAKPGGTISFFEYIAIRNMRSIVCRRQERLRLKQIGLLLKEMLAEHEIRRDWVLSNIPPAWVHHVQTPKAPVDWDIPAAPQRELVEA